MFKGPTVAEVAVIPTPYATLRLCDACDVCGRFGCLDDHGLCDAVNPEQTAGCFREPMHDGLHTFEFGRAITEPHDSASCTCPSGDGSLRWPCPTHPPTGPIAPEPHVEGLER
jgi:hypothetical protein